MNILTSNHITSMSAEAARVYPARPYPVQTRTEEKIDAARRFDSVSIETDRRGNFELELRGKLKQEVRAATSSGQVAALRAQVHDGSYQADPAAIARKMLLIGEAV